MQTQLDQAYAEEIAGAMRESDYEILEDHRETWSSHAWVVFVGEWVVDKMTIRRAEVTCSPTGTWAVVVREVKDAGASPAVPLAFPEGIEELKRHLTDSIL